jgi:hypothetical protein
MQIDIDNSPIHFLSCVRTSIFGSVLRWKCEVEQRPAQNTQAQTVDSCSYPTIRYIQYPDKANIERTERNNNA